MLLLKHNLEHSLNRFLFLPGLGWRGLLVAVLACIRPWSLFSKASLGPLFSVEDDHHISLAVQKIVAQNIISVK